MAEDPHPPHRSGAAHRWPFADLGSTAPGVHADAGGVRCRGALRRVTIPWQDVVALRVHRAPMKSGERRRVSLLLRDGRVRSLPRPRSYRITDPEFDAEVEALRVLHRRHGTPAEPDHLHVITTRTGGHGVTGPIAWCVPLLLVAMVISLWAVPNSLADERAWRAVVPCTAATPLAERGECLSTLPGVVVRTDVHERRKYNSLYVSAGRKTDRIRVSHETAGAFARGDRLEVTFWRGRPRAFTGAHGQWHEHRAPAGQLLALAVALVLAAGYPAARAVQRVRGRRLPDDEVLPSALPFAGALLVTALWLLPLCVLHPTDMLGSPTTTTWAGVGAAVTAGLLVLAFHVSRVRPPRHTVRAGDAGNTENTENTKDTKDTHDADDTVTADGEAVFLSARFLEATEYNPHHFGTHVVLGGGDVLAVSPHAGPGRFGVHRVPVERLTLLRVRRVRGGDGDEVSRGWHVAEFDDAGTPVRLSAAPDDLARILRALERAAAAGEDTERARSKT
ncbi:PH domain-containing protein [Streptomyces sp. NPDC005576]|uniref:PH domain-containing protein n=1 Tax=Streptomyces sp. NPDC005576 TaxID=3364726 RepID=UPI00367F14C8